MTSLPWKPSGPVAYLLGAPTVWPIAHFIFFLGLLIFMFDSTSQKSGAAQGVDLFKYVFLLHLLTMLLMFALTAIYVVHAFRNDQLASDKRILWVLVLFFGNMLAFPVYWWFYVRPTSPAAAGITPQG